MATVNLTVIWCLLSIGPVIFSPFFGQLWECVSQVRIIYETLLYFNYSGTPPIHLNAAFQSGFSQCFSDLLSIYVVYRLILKHPKHLLLSNIPIIGGSEIQVVFRNDQDSGR